MNKQDGEVELVYLKEEENQAIAEELFKNELVLDEVKSEIEHVSSFQAKIELVKVKLEDILNIDYPMLADKKNGLLKNLAKVRGDLRVKLEQMEGITEDSDIRQILTLLLYSRYDKKSVNLGNL